MRVASKLGWVHVGCTELLTHLRLGESRGDIMTGVTGIAVHDHWKSYFTRLETEHGMCVAHLLRELQALVDHGSESWAQEMIECLAEAIKAAKDGTPPDHRIAELKESYDALVAEGIRHHESRTTLPSKRRGRRKRRLGHNLAIRLCDFRRETLRFLQDPDVPPTNNQAERDLRYLKVKQKISGGFRTEAGARDHLVLQSIIGTVIKHGWPVFAALQMSPVGLIEKLGVGSPLPET